jgi:RNA polymerase sigma-70 factor (ECF subfamily)
LISKKEFADIYEEFFPKLLSYISYRVNDADLADDLVSQVFFKALRNLEKYDEGKGKISTWLYTITSNTIIDHYRKDEIHESLDDYENHFCTFDTTSEDMDLEIDYDKVSKIMKNLPLKTQEIINLRIFQELPFTEIARII